MAIHKIIERLGGLDKARKAVSLLRREQKDPICRKRMVVIERAIHAYERDMLIQSNKKLSEGLNEIANPIKYMKKRLKADEHLNGLVAIHLSEDHNHLKSIAKRTLNESEKVYTNQNQ